MGKRINWIIPPVIVLSTTFSSLVQAELTLDPYFTIATGSYPEAVAIADLNNDGLEDVALITSFYFDPDNDYMLKVYLQDAFGNLGQAINYPLIESTDRPKSISVGDLNNDGLQDVAVGLDRGFIQVFVQNQNGSLELADTIETSYSTRIAVGDLNADGLDDICGIAHGDQNVGVFYQSQTGLYHQEETFYAPHGGFDDMVLGDINDDGLNDIVVMSGQGYDDNLAIVPSNGLGGFSTTVFYDLGGNERTHGVAIGDMNNDGKNDVALTYGGNSPGSMIAIFTQNQFGLLESPVSYVSYDIPESIVAADLNHDQRDELIVVHGGWESLGVYEQTMSGNTLPEQLFDLPYASHYNPQGLTVGDINNDDINDIVIADYNHGLVILYGNAAPTMIEPVAVAGPDQQVDQNTTVFLDGLQSYDDDGSIETYSWTQTSGVAVQLMDANSAVASFFPPQLPDGQSAQLTFKLEVTDDGGLQSMDTVVVFINPIYAPVADSGSDQSAMQNSTVQMDGSLSYDTDGSIVSYNWTQLSGTLVALAGATTPYVSFTTPVLPADQTDELIFQLEVVDNDGLVATDTVSIFVEANQAPIANAGDDQSVKQNILVQVNGNQSSDEDGEIVKYTWTQLSGIPVQIVNSSSANMQFESPILPPSELEELTFQLVVEDDLGLTATDTVKVIILPNLAPIANAGNDYQLKQRRTGILDASSSVDSDGEIISYSWTQVSGMAVQLNNSNSATASFQAPKLRGLRNAVLVFEVTVVDDLNQVSTDQIVVTVEK